MNVRLLPSDSSGCRFYRLECPARAAGALGIRGEVSPPVLYRQSTMRGELPVDIQRGDTDVFVLHRPTFPAAVELIGRLQGEGAAVVVDVDDDLCAPHPKHAWARPKAHLNPSQQVLACQKADLVTVSTQPLAAAYAPHGRVMVLPNCVPASLLTLESVSDGRTVGWSGSVVGHPGDLPVTAGGVATAVQGGDWRFMVVGSALNVRSEMRLSQEVPDTGGLPIGDYHQALGQLDIGIVPLADTRFNRAKSFLKGLEYAARGVPFVASALPEYEQLAEEGVGLVARDGARDWCGRLRDLMRDESLYLEQVQQGRQVLADRHTYETQGQRWVDAWQQAISNRRSRA